GVFLIAMVAGYFSAQPKLMSYLDVTHNKANTLTEASQEVMAKLDDDLTITTYSNMLGPPYGFAMPQNYKNDVSLFRHYVRFKPEIKMKYRFYYHKTENEHLDRQFPTLNDKQRMDTLRKLLNIKFDVSPYDDIRGEVDLEPEKFRFVRLLERGNGKRTFLR